MRPAIGRDHMAPLAKQATVLRGIFRTFRYLNSGERRRAVFVVALTFANALLGLIGLASILPFFELLVRPEPLAGDSLVGAVFAGLGVQSETQAILIAGAAVIGLVLAKNLLAIYHNRIVGLFCAAVETRLANEFLERISTAPFAWFLRQNSSILRDVVMKHVVEVARGIMRPALNLMNSGLIVVTAFALIIPTAPLVTLGVALVTAAIAVGFVRLARPKIELASRRKRHANLLAGVSAGEAITGGRDVRMSRAGEVLRSEFGRHYSSYAYSDANARQWQIVPRSGIEVIGMGALVAIAIVAIALGADRVDVAATLAIFAVVAVRLMPVIGDVANALSLIQISLPALEHMDALAAELPPAPQAAGLPLPADWSALSLEGVTFAYSGTKDGALRGIDLTIRRGKTYGVVGSSGAGKSTLADVLAGLLQPSAGQMRVDDVPIDGERSMGEWRRRVSYVSQSPLIFDTSLKDNIVLGSIEPDLDARLHKALLSAGLLDVVAHLADGVATSIGDRGTRLSGGQRQRVAIARAIFQHADLMILDEATSALDSLTEQEVVDAMNLLQQDMTVVAIAHRLSTIVHCDEIFLLAEGRLLARGSHEELLRTSAEYREFVEAQSAGHAVGPVEASR